MAHVLDQDFYLRDTDKVARALLGQTLVHRLETGEERRGRIVEVEAYLGAEDPACHTFGGRQTTRVSSMYLEGGHSYVYLIYGLYHCLNVVTRTASEGEAVLIRALEIPYAPELGPPPLRKRLTNGPGKLCRHFQLDKRHDGLKLWKKKSGLWIEEGPALSRKKIIAAPRVGVDYAGEAADWRLRFFEAGNPFVSKGTR